MSWGKKIIQFVDNEAAYKLVFDNVRNIGLAAAVGTISQHEFAKGGTWGMFNGTLFGIAGAFLFFSAFSHFRWRVADLFGWRRSFWWLGIDVLYVYMAYRVFITFIFAFNVSGK
ncbi:hypothetical protein ACO0LL_02325 [Undibacterium sp. TC4M20W]|uniref:hypothetical protein n=1 Tax=Undibacterium sp. TC4M20W TaxID=3413052 RepID=UPI003BF41511